MSEDDLALQSLHEEFMNDAEYRLVFAEEELIHRVAEGVLRRRRALEMTQEDLAKAADTHQAYIPRIEAGYVNVTLRLLARLACALSCEPQDLIGVADPAWTLTSTRGRHRNGVWKFFHEERSKNGERAARIRWRKKARP